MTKNKWQKMRLGDLALYMNGRAFKPSEWKASGRPIIRIQNLTDPTNPMNCYEGEVEERYIVHNGDLLISWSATLGAFIWNRGEALLNQHIFRVIPHPDVVQKEFLYYLVLYQLVEMNKHTHGSTMKHITKNKLETLEVEIPPLAEQRRIVARLQELLARVDEIRTLREEAAREVEILPTLLYTETIQKGKWPLASIGDVILESQNGRSIQPINMDANGRVLSLSSVRNVILDLQQNKTVLMTKEIAEKYSFQRGDVFISRANTIDLVGLASVAAQDCECNMIYPDLLIKLVANPKRILPYYLAYALRLLDTRRQIKSRAKGTSQSMVKISGKSLKEIRIPLPPLDIQQKIVERLEKYREMSQEIKKNIGETTIDAMQDAILRKAFAGEL